MALSDILAKLLGANKQPDETAGTALAGNVFTPGTEQILSAIPLLVGSYEQGRGRPIGGPLEALGQLGMTNAANRQTKHQDEGDVAARMESLSQRGLLPNPGSDNPIYQMTAPAADKELSDIESQQIAEQKLQNKPHLPNLKWDKLGRAWINDPMSAMPKRYPTADVQGGGSGDKLSAPVRDQLAAMGVNPASATPDQIKAALNGVVQMSAGRTSANLLSKAATMPKLPMSMISPNTAVYRINKDGSYTPVNGLGVSYQDYVDGKAGVVPKGEQAQFDQQRTAMKLLDRFNAVVSSKATAGHYIPTKPGLRSYIGEPAREFAAMIDPSAAARPNIDATILSELIAKNFTSRTIQAQLQRIATSLFNPHGTVASTKLAIDETKKLLQTDASGMLQRGDSAVGGDRSAFLNGAPPLVAEPTPAPDGDDDGGY